MFCFFLLNIYPLSSISLFFFLFYFTGFPSPISRLLSSSPVLSQYSSLFALCFHFHLLSFGFFFSLLYAFLLPLTPFSLSNPIHWIFDQLRQQEETLTSSLFIHSPLLPPSVHPLSLTHQEKWNRPGSLNEKDTQAPKNITSLFLIQMSTASRSLLLCSLQCSLSPSSLSVS